MVPVPIATVHRARVSGEFELTFACTRCGERSTATVRATGSGEATGIPLAARPADLAVERAKADLPADARELVELARCPKCQRRAARGIRGWWLVQIVQVAFVLGIFAGVPALLFRFAFEMPVPLTDLGVLVLVLTPLYLALRFFLRLRRVDRSVVFTSS